MIHSGSAEALMSTGLKKGEGYMAWSHCDKEIVNTAVISLFLFCTSSVTTFALIGF